MKTILSFTWVRGTTFAVALSVVSGVAGAPTVAAQTITNSSYEDGLTGWTTFVRPGATVGQAVLNPNIFIPTPANHDGIRRIGIAGTTRGDDTGGGVYQQVNGFTPGSPVTVSYWGFIGADTDAGNDTLWLYWIDGPAPSFANGLPAQAQPLAVLISTGVPAIWNLLQGTFTPTGSSVTLISYWDFHGGATAIHGVHVDDWSITIPGGGTPTPTCPPNPVANLLNASFETLSGISPANWTPFGNTEAPALSGPWFGGIHAYDGLRFFGAAANFEEKDGGRYQRLWWCGGNSLTARVYISTSGDTTTSSGCRIGVDPAGGINPAAGSIVWSALARTTGENIWQQISVGPVNVTNSSYVTVFLQHEHASDGGRFNVTAFDLVSIQAGVAATPTPTPGADRDGDGIPDASERMEPGAGQTSLYLDDSDLDGVSDGVEDANRNGVRDAGETGARLWDSDGDQWCDGVERVLGSDPLSAVSPGSVPDSDNDRLPDSVDPDDTRADADGDRFRDWYEAARLSLAAVTSAGMKPYLGDVNLDGTPTNVDALIVQAFFLHVIDLDNPVWQGSGFVNSDPSGDAIGTNVDALILQSFFLLSLPLLPLQ